MMASLPLQIPCPEFAVPGRVDLLEAPRRIDRFAQCQLNCVGNLVDV